MPAPGKVLLLHGIARTAASLAGLERMLQAAGFRTLNLDYPSRTHPLEDLAGHVHRAAAGFIAADDAPVHVVTHSMGGLLARAYLTRHRPAAQGRVVLGRVVMLGPPNGGSEVADLLVRTAPYRRIFGPAGAQLTTGGGDALRAVLGPVDYPLGIIAGCRSIYPLGSLVIPGQGDGRVSVASTRVAGMADHLVLPVTHPLMMRSPTVMRQTLHFLRHGRFAPG